MAKSKLFLTKLSFSCVLLLLALSQNALSVEISSNNPTTTNSSLLSLESFFMNKHNNSLSLHNLGASNASYTFSGTIADTINYIQLCNATDNTCGTCNAPVLTITGGAGLPYTTGGTTYKINNASLAAYLTQAGFGTGTYNIGMYVQGANSSNCSSGYCGTNADNGSHKLCMTTTFNGTNVTNITQQDNGIAILNTAKYQSIYVGDQSQNIYQCTANSSNGSISASSCSAYSIGYTGGPAVGVAFVTLNNVQYSYFTNSLDSVDVCSVNPGVGGGNFLGCTSTGNIGFNEAYSVAVNTAKNQTQYVYVGDIDASDVTQAVYQCSIHNSDGNLYNCSDIIDHWKPYEFAFATLDNNSQYVYIAAAVSGTAKIESCSINNSGTFTSCAAVAPSGVGSWVPSGVAVARINGILYAYINDTGNGGAVWKCPIASNGNLSTCTQQTAYNAVSTVPTGITVALVNGTEYAYVTDGSSGGQVYACSINNSTGNFTSCTSGTYLGSGTPIPTAAVAATYY